MKKTAGNSKNSELFRCYFDSASHEPQGFPPNTRGRPLIISWKNSENSEKSQFLATPMRKLSSALVAEPEWTSGLAFIVMTGLVRLDLGIHASATGAAV